MPIPKAHPDESRFEITINVKAPRKLGTCTNRKLFPGENVIKDMTRTELALIEGHKVFQGWLAMNEVSISKPAEAAPAPPSAKPADVKPVVKKRRGRKKKVPTDLTDLSEEAAVAAIAACSDPDVLERWHDADTRTAVHEAALERSEALAAAANA